MQNSNILIVGTGIVGIGLLVLGAVVAELNRNGRRAGLLMGVGLGLGIFAFSAKLALIVAYGLFGNRYLAYMLPQDMKPEPYVERLGDTVRKPLVTGTGHIWEALPRLPPEPADNPTTPDKVALGRQLFNDVRLSVDDSLSCASCHDLAGAGGSDGRPVSLGVAGQAGGRNAPTVVNAAYQAVLFWDGRAASLEEQATGPLVNPIEMGMPDLQAVAMKVASVPGYRQAFSKAFGNDGPIDAADIARAIAAYERTLVTPDTPYDRFVRGDSAALTAQQLRGMALFAEFGCVMCHAGPNFSDASRIGGSAPFRAFPALPGSDYEQRYRLTQDTGLAAPAAGERGVWRIPSLRNVTRTAPYFHNGSVTDLREAVRVMARVQLDKPSSNRAEDDWQVLWSAEQRATAVRANAALSDAEVDDIVAFLGALEGEVAGGGR